MCGIVGIHGSEAEGADLSASLSALALRGPDRQAYVLSGLARLGQSRLSIIDTSAASDQPMQDPSGRYTLVFNGEIYNYRTLAARLAEQGVTLQSSGDTEVLLHWLILHGTAGLKDLNGFFALAFHDKEKEETIIVRDRLGIKPLYWATLQDSLLFASEMKAIAPLMPEKKIDPVSVDLFFQLNYIPGPHSIYDEIHHLLPGHFLTHSAGKTKIQRYYEIRHSQKKNYASPEKELYSLLEGSVRKRLVADVPLGSFLSGGVDSSIIAALAVKEKKDLKTFSIGFRDQGYFDESQYAEQVARHIGSDHRTLHIHEEELLHSLDAVLDYIDEPFADSSAIAVYALSHFARKEVSVALSGDGADELFGGYNKHQAHLRAIASPWTDGLFRASRPVWSMLPSGRSSGLGNRVRQIERYLSAADAAAADRFWKWSSWTSEENLEALLSLDVQGLSKEARKRYLPLDEGMEEVLRCDSELVLPNDMLVKVDRMSMANSLEVRVPFLDHEVVDFAHQLSASQRLAKGKGKFILEQTFASLLPAEIFQRKKKGFEVPLESWFLGPLNSRMKAVLEDGLLTDSGYFKKAGLKKLAMDLNRKDIGDQVHLMWALMVFHGFLKKNIPRNGF